MIPWETHSVMLEIATASTYLSMDWIFVFIYFDEIYASIPSTCCFTFLRICLFVLPAGWRLPDISLLFLHVCLLFLHIPITFNIILLHFQYTFGCIVNSRAYCKYISADFQYTVDHTFNIYYPDVSTFRLTCSNIWRLFQHVGVRFVHICLLSIHIFVTGT